MCQIDDIKCCSVFQMEQIKRANSLWTNDSLFLRDRLLIPVPSDTAVSEGTLHQQLPPPCVASGFHRVPRPCQRMREEVRPVETTETVALTATAADYDVNHVDASEYFDKYDSLLAKVKHGASQLHSQ